MMADSCRGPPRARLIDQTLDVRSEFRVRGEKVAPITVRILFPLRLAVRLHQWRFYIGLSSEKVCELFIAQLGVTICVHAANDSKDLSLDQVVTEGSEELLQIAYIDAAFLVTINGAKRCKCRIVGTLL